MKNTILQSHTGHIGATPLTVGANCNLKMFQRTRIIK
jgi:hypothetical protein